MIVYLCDEDLEFLNRLRIQTIRCMGSKIFETRIFTDAERLFDRIEEDFGRPNILLISVEMENGRGIELARRVIKIMPDVQIIFLSESDDYFLDVYSVRHIYFLKKPIEEERLKEGLLQAEDALIFNERRFFSIINKTEKIKVPIELIEYAETMKRLLCLHTGERSYSCYKKLGEFLDSVKQYPFVQCHKSFVVNFNYVVEMKSKCFVLYSGEEVPISQRFRKEVEEKYINYLEIKGVKHREITSCSSSD